MKFRVLVIDPVEKVRSQLLRLLKQDISELVLYSYDPIARGQPVSNFNWMTYDLVILSSDLGEDNGTGLDWLRAIKSAEGSPGVIMLCATQDEALMETYKEMGADECLAKEKLTRRMLTSAVSYIVKFNQLTRSREESAQRKQKGPELPGYKVGKVLNTTDHSSLYLVKSEAENKPYVVKTLFSEWLDDDSLVERFVNEYELIHEIQHPNVVKLHQLGFTEEFIYIIMDYLPGGSLFERIQEWNIKHTQAFRYLWQISSGLECLHDQGILHRDLKPSNVMFKNADQLMLIDFGISKQLENINEDLTNSNIVMGTLPYMSPEAVTALELDERSDVYSLGIMFYEMLVGSKPFRPIAPVDVLKYHRQYDGFKLEGHLKQFQPFLDKMVASDRNDRFASMPSLQDYIKEHYAQYLEFDC